MSGYREVVAQTPQSREALVEVLGLVSGQHRGPTAILELEFEVEVANQDREHADFALHQPARARTQRVGKSQLAGYHLRVARPQLAR